MRVKFELTEDHIKLARRLSVGWNSYSGDGAPGACCKRPYGNQDWLSDVREILTGQVNAPLSETEADRVRYRKIHFEMGTALRIILVTGSFVPGTYEALTWMQDWKLITS